MNKKKYIVILILALLGMLCMAGASAWIIANPFTSSPLWHDAKPKFYVKKTVEIDFGAPHTLGDVKRGLVFLNEKGENITASVGSVYLMNFTDGQKSYSRDNESVDIGTTYSFQIDLPNLSTEYAFGGTYESYDEEAKQLTGVERGTLQNTTLLFKYKTVRLNDAFYTVEDALDCMPEEIEVSEVGDEPQTTKKSIAEVTAEGGSKETIAIVEADTAFAHPDVARAAGYLDGSGKPQKNYYNVRGTLLVPYADTAVGFISTGLMDSEAVDDPETEEDDAKKSDPAVRAAATAFTQDYGKTEPPSPNGKEPYVTLTVRSGVALSVAGRLVVNAVISSSNGNTSRVNGNYYGDLNVEDDARVSLESGSTFDCVGFTYGEGELTAKDGANVFEPFNAVGWKGGGETLSAYNSAKGVFPLAQYTVASLVAKTVFQKGSVYSLRAYVAGSLGNVLYACAPVSFVSATEGSFLQIEEGTVTKQVNEEEGKLHFIADGEISVNNLGMEVMGTQINTAGMDVPVPGHLEMVINSGTTKIPNGVSLKMLPGAQVRIERGATLEIGGKALSYGETNGEDGKQGNFQDGALQYPIARLAQVYRIKPTLGYDATTPARVVVNGTLTVAETATVAAEIKSEGGGVADISLDLDNVDDPTDPTKTKKKLPSCAVKEYGPDGFYEVTLESKWWNGDETATFVRPGKWKYVKGTWIGSSWYEVRYHLDGGELPGVKDGEWQRVEKDVWDGTNTFKPATPTKKHYYFEGWYSDSTFSDDKRVETAEVQSESQIDLYAKWSPITYTVYGRIGEEERELGTWVYGESGALQLDQAQKDGFDFFGWYLQEAAVGERIEAVDPSTVDRIVQGEQNGREIPLYLYGRFEEADSTVSVKFIYQAPTAFETDQADNYPVLDSVLEAGIPLGMTFDLAGMPANAFNVDEYNYNLEREYYFEGWFAEDGSIVTPDKAVDRSLDTNGDGTVTVTARWTKKYRLSIRLESNHGGLSNRRGFAYILGFELIYARNPEPISKQFENDNEDGSGKNSFDFRDYIYWFMPGETFDLRLFYQMHPKSENPEDLNNLKEKKYDEEHMGGEKITITMDRNHSMIYSCTSEKAKRTLSLKRDPDETENP